MSGHSKWSTIKRKKAATDAKRSKAFSKVLKEIAVAVKEGGGTDPESNPRLRTAITNAKGVNLPKENLERAIKKAGDKDSASLSESTYEGYAQNGIAVFLECTTDNINRTVSNVRSIFTKHGGTLGTNGSLEFIFDRKGVFTIPAMGLDEDDFTLEVIDGGAEDVSRESQWGKPIWDLLDAVDASVPIPDRPTDLPFLMPVEDVFGIKGRGTVVTGRVEQGMVKTGDQVEIVGIRETTSTVVTGVELFHKTLSEGESGDAVGLLLRGVERGDIERGQVVAAPGSITPHSEAKAQVYVLTKEEGGRHTPFFTGYKPQFYIRTTDVTGEIKLPEGVEMVMPGDNIEMGIKLILPVAMEEQLRFAVREGGRTVGAGVVVKVTE